MGWWRTSALDALDSLNADQLKGVADPSPEMVTRAAQIYSTATNWEQANALAASVAIPFADRYSPTDIAHVLNASSYGADLRGSHGFSEFIGLLFDKNPITNTELEVLLDEHGLKAYKRAPQLTAD
jgi:hypothetical protein